MFQDNDNFAWARYCAVFTHKIVTIICAMKFEPTGYGAIRSSYYPIILKKRCQISIILIENNFVNSITLLIKQIYVMLCLCFNKIVFVPLYNKIIST